MDKIEIKDALREAIEEDRKNNRDSYRSVLLFLAGLISFSGAIIVGVFANFPEAANTSLAKTLGGLAAWMAITVIIATICAGLIQLRKSKSVIKPAFPELFILTVIPVIPGLIAAAYIIRWGASLLSACPGSLPGFTEVLNALLP